MYLSEYKEALLELQPLSYRVEAEQKKEKKQSSPAQMRKSKAEVT